MKPSKTQKYILDALDGPQFTAVYRSSCFHNRKIGFTTALLMRLKSDLLSGKAKHMDTVVLVSNTLESARMMFKMLIMGLGGDFVMDPLKGGHEISVKGGVTVKVVFSAVSSLYYVLRGVKVDLVYADVTYTWVKDLFPFIFGVRIFRMALTETERHTTEDIIDKLEGCGIRTTPFDSRKIKLS